MLSTIRRYFNRNRKPLLVTSGIVTALYFTIGYLRKKFEEYQLKLAEERFSREQIRRRFEQTQKDALYTIYALAPFLSDPILKSLDVEGITDSLKARRLNKRRASGPNESLNGDDISSTADSNLTGQLRSTEVETEKSKNELWSELKSASLTRFLTLVYANAALILFTRLQLNILARREYLDDALKIAASKHGFKQKIELVDNTNEQENYLNESAFLSFNWWLLNRGWLSLRDIVANSVDQIFKDINPRTELSLDDFANLLRQTQDLIENSNPGFLTSSLLPPSTMENFVIQQTLDEQAISSLANGDSRDNLRILLDETYNYINSSSSLIVLSSEVNVGISTFLNYIALSLTSKSQSDTIEEVKPNEIKVKLAVLLANTTKAANDFRHLTTSNGNQYINNMEKAAELDELSASVYSNFD